MEEKRLCHDHQNQYQPIVREYSREHGYLFAALHVHRSAYTGAPENHTDRVHEIGVCSFAMTFINHKTAKLTARDQEPTRSQRIQPPRYLIIDTRCPITSTQDQTAAIPPTGLILLSHDDGGDGASCIRVPQCSLRWRQPQLLRPFPACHGQPRGR